MPVSVSVSPFKQRLLEQTQTAQADAGTLDAAPPAPVNPDAQTAPVQSGGIRQSILAGVDAGFQSDLKTIQDRAISRNRLRSGVTSNDELSAARVAAQNRIAQIGQFETQEQGRRETLTANAANIEIQGEQARATIGAQSTADVAGIEASGEQDRLNIAAQGTEQRENITTTQIGNEAVQELINSGQISAIEAKGLTDITTTEKQIEGQKALQVLVNSGQITAIQAQGVVEAAKSAAQQTLEVAVQTLVNQGRIAEVDAKGLIDLANIGKQKELQVAVQTLVNEGKIADTDARGVIEAANILAQTNAALANIQEQNTGALSVAQEVTTRQAASDTASAAASLAVAKEGSRGQKDVAIQQGLNSSNVADKQAAGALAVEGVASGARTAIVDTQSISASAVATIQASGALAVEQERSRIASDLAVISTNLQREIATGQIETAIPTVHDAEVLVDALTDSELAMFMGWDPSTIPQGGWDAEARKNIAENIYNTKKGSIPVESLQSKQLRLQKLLTEMTISADVAAASELTTATKAEIRETSEAKIVEIEKASAGRIAELKASGASALEIQTEENKGTLAVATERNKGSLAVAVSNNNQIIATAGISAKMQTDIALAASTERTSIAQIATDLAVSRDVARAVIDNALIASNERIQMENLDVEGRKVAIAKADQEARANISLHQLRLQEKAQAFGETVTTAQVTGMWQEFGPEHLSALSDAMGSSFGDDNYNGASDLDGNGQVNFQDFLVGAALSEVGGVTTLEFQALTQAADHFTRNLDAGVDALADQLGAQADESKLSRAQETALAVLTLSTSTAMQDAGLDFKQLELIGNLLMSPAYEAFTPAERAGFIDSILSKPEFRTAAESNPKIKGLAGNFAQLPEFMANSLKSMGVESPVQYMEWVVENFAAMEVSNRQGYVTAMDFNDDGIVDNADLLLYYGGA